MLYILLGSHATNQISRLHITCYNVASLMLHMAWGYDRMNDAKLAKIKIMYNVSTVLYVRSFPLEESEGYAKVCIFIFHSIFQIKYFTHSFYL
jgi:hypothetical protein